MEKRKNIGNIMLQPVLGAGIVVILSAMSFAACSNSASASETKASANTPAEVIQTSEPLAVCSEQPVVANDSITLADSAKKVCEVAEAPQPKPAEVKEKADNGIYSVVEQQAEFPGGEDAMLQFINSHMQYPTDASFKGIQGRVLIDFVVEKDGSLSNFGILRSPNESLSQEAIRVAQLMPKWKPGKKQGKIVRSRYVLPVQFHL